MIKTGLLIVALSSGVYETEMPTMKECLQARTQIVEQDASIEAICIPQYSVDTEEIVNDWIDRFYPKCRQEGDIEWPRKSQD
jgi:hypothetical protein|tara:strand:+ start:484 stop:729 length:246 start_codon:yes stop_codon:yes gene_type:complete